MSKYFGEENLHLEFKREWNDKCLEEICGFANTEGGTLLVGVDDEGYTYGLEDSSKLFTEISNHIKEIGVTANLFKRNDESKNYIEIRINFSPNPVDFKGKFYIRIGDTNHTATGNQLKDLLLKNSAVIWDRDIQENASLDDVDEESIMIFKQEAKKGKRIDEILRLPTQEFLTALGLYSDQGITKAAIILFGNKPGMYFSNPNLKIGRFDDENDKLYYHDLVENNLIKNLQRTLELLEKTYFVKKVEFERINRIEILEYPIEAIREIILNALIHRNYLNTNEIKVIVHHTRFSVWSPGKLMPELNIDNLLLENRSILRNPLVAEVCFKAGLIDAWGSGMKKIRSACTNANLHPPKYQIDAGGVFVELRQKVDNNQEIKTTDKYSIDISHLSENEKTVIALMRKDNTITIARMVEKSEFSLGGIQDIVRRLREKGVIVRVGSDKSGHWNILI